MPVTLVLLVLLALGVLSVALTALAVALAVATARLLGRAPTGDVRALRREARQGLHTAHQAARRVAADRRDGLRARSARRA